MSNLEPESEQEAAPDGFEVEISDLFPEAGGQDLPPVSLLPGARLSLRGRAWRVLIMVSSALLALLVIVASNVAWRRQAAALLFGAAVATPTPAAVRLAPQRPPPRPADWLALEARPLRLPAVAPGSPCPATHGRMVSSISGVAAGSGPVFASYGAGSAQDGVLVYSDARFLGDGGESDWGAQAVLWTLAPAYAGPALVRGRQLDGPNVVRFNGGFDQQHVAGSWSKAPLLGELRLVGNADAVSWMYWASYTRLRAPGCYAYQVDGFTFSYLIIFQARPEG